MHMMYFTEQPMAAYDAKAGLDYGATALTFSNKYYDSNEGSRLYNEYLKNTSWSTSLVPTGSC